ncbi:electron transport complex subunit RsxC [Corallincola spongiicola]|uniref:Ion-translocating oxidoreductase complex subunit C n=1 Tax=Corallincola spongiicola TaxID=2520508 RepID=A0ABY1WV20_9GAMM|nr:electron transport complex subunit RsxC [Corallincola spongiicola]TAA48583.1 electron transport complex subunit RsxC [Corallincola spongiicola]
METTFELVKEGKLWDFPGGIHPPIRKEVSTAHPIKRFPLPDHLYLPLKQHIGRGGRLLVAVGDSVKKGQQLTTGEQGALPIHAPTSGKVEAITDYPSAHPSALPEPTLVMRPDGNEAWVTKTPIDNPLQQPAKRLIQHIADAGIAGLGGAGFPAARKLSGAPEDIEFLIINGAECEPYISCDDMLMREHAREIALGIELLVHILRPKLVLVGIEDDKQQAITAITEATSTLNVEVRAIPTKYPSGGEKQLVQLLTGREVPSDGLPYDAGVVMHNVGTTFAIKRAIYDGEPLLERVVTVTGDAVGQPGNYWAHFGTPVRHLLEQANYQSKHGRRIIMGGPMMGFTLPHANIPLVKISNCILAPSENELPLAGKEMPCIRCGQCADACPASLLPQQLFWYSSHHELEKAREYKLFDCIECGACAYVCPSEIPLVHYYRKAKSELRQHDADALKSEKARIRFEARNERLEQEKLAREAKHREAVAKRQAAVAGRQGAQDAVAAALARVKSKQTTEVADAKASVDAQGNLVPDNQQAIDAREQRKAQAAQRRAEKVAQSTQKDSSATTDAAHSADNNKTTVAAAVARAKAKAEARKEVQDNKEVASNSEVVDNASPANEAMDAKKAAVAAAVARAKAKAEAKKSNNAAQIAETDSTQNTATAAAIEDSDAAKAAKKAAVAAAVARAKAKAEAKKQAQYTADEPSNSDVTQDEPNSKQAAIAAAVAKAKAKALARQEAQKNQQAASSERATDDSPGDK